MISVAAEIDRNTVAKWRAMAKRYPKEARRAWNGVTLRAKNSLAKTVGVRGGRHGVPTWAETSVITRSLVGRTQAGGKIADPRVIVRYKNGDSQFIGWPDGVEKYAMAIQTDESRPFSDEEKIRFTNRMRQRGMSRPLIRDMLRTVYSRPARNTIDPFLNYEFPKMGPDLIKRTERAIAKAIAK